MLRIFFDRKLSGSRIGLVLTLLIILVSLAFTSCGSSGSVSTQDNMVTAGEETEAPVVYNSRAIRHYTSGLNAELEGNYAMAALEYQQALRYDSSSVTIYADLSNAYMALRRYDQAEEVLQSGLRQIGSDNMELLTRLGRVYYITEQNEDALQIYQRVSTSAEDKQLRLTALEYSADIYVRLRQFKAAAETYERLYESGGGMSDYLVRAQNLYLRLEDYASVRRILNKLITEYPDRIQYKMELASLYTESGRVDSAMAVLQPVAEEYPESEAAGQLGEIYFQQGMTDSAYTTLQPLFHGDSTDVRVLYYLGGASLNNEEFNEAERYYGILVEQHPDVLGGYFGQAVALQRQERYTEAISILSQGTERFPEDPDLYDQLGLNYYFAGQKDSAWYNLDQAYAIDSTLSGYYTLAVELRNNERPEDALEVLSRVQNNYQTETELQEQFGITYYMNEQYVEARDYFTDVHSRNPDLMRPKHFLAFIYDQLGNRDSAEVMYQQLLEEIPDEPLYLNNLAYIYAVQGKNLDTALQYVKKALDREPDNASYLDTIGWIYYQMGEYQEARDFVLQALEHDSTNAEVLDHMGDIYSKLGEVEKAREYYRRALESNPDDQAIRNKLPVSSD